jgi:hypothetical protein
MKRISRRTCIIRDVFFIPPKKEQMGQGVSLSCKRGQKIGL